MTAFWPAVLDASASRRGEFPALVAAAETRRHRATYNTGSILEVEAFALLALAVFVQARVVIEVGTFIGTSTTALASAPTVEALYTCDASNDCLPSAGVIHAYPMQSSHHMLRNLLARGVKADLCFFDGTLTEKDADLLGGVTHRDTLYAFHDYNYGPKIRRKGGAVRMETMPRKGIGNVRLLRPRLPEHVLVDPLEGTTLALLVPVPRSNL